MLLGHGREVESGGGQPHHRCKPAPAHDRPPAVRGFRTPADARDAPERGIGHVPGARETPPGFTVQDLEFKVQDVGFGV